MFTSLHIQGNLISEELLKQVAEGAAPGQQAPDFGFEPGTRLSNEIEYAWSRIRLEWKRFSDKRDTLPATDSYGTTLTRRWMEDFLKALGFDLSRANQSLEGGNGQRYTISHTADNPAGLPVHIVGFKQPDADSGKEVNTLDVRSSGGTSRLSPHSTVQEYLNVTNHVYGLVTNGLQLRLLRDCGRLVKFTYIEFDLRRMLEQDQYADFTLLYRLLHCSRFGSTDDAEGCWLEQYYKQSIETGNRIRDGLSKAVKEALMALGNGFVSHPDNDALRTALANGTLSAKDYYRELLRLVYRLLFLLVTEERDLVYDPDDKSEETARYRSLYRKFYSLDRLRRLSEHRYLYNEAYTDLWPALQATFRLFEAEGNGQKLGIQPLGGDLFSDQALLHIGPCTLANRLLLECLRNMNEFTDPQSRSLVTINYRALDVEELGSVYEGLLDLHPVIVPAGGLLPVRGTESGPWSFTFHEGTDRKTTGSYYTRPDLVNELIKTALIPVIEERLRNPKAYLNEEQIQKASPVGGGLQGAALLALKVCDPAAGSGHMLLAAARTIAWYLARVQSGDENPGPSVYRRCLRQVIQQCIYAVDQNPDAVELCKLALWLESHNSGKPLSFLDKRIRNGNSLVGVTDLGVLSQPLPDAAYNPVTGDNAAACAELKKQNRQFRKTGQGELFSEAAKQVERDSRNWTKEDAAVDAIEQNDLTAINQISRRYAEARRSRHHEEQACHIWTAAFFKTYTDDDDLSNPTSQRLMQYFDAPTQFGQLAGEAAALAEKHKFFHWPLEFPDVWAQGGFDVMLGNPPWEIVELSEKEFFKPYSKEIVEADSSAKRKKLIEQFKRGNPDTYHKFVERKHETDCSRKFFQHSGRFPLASKGRIDLYPLFLETSLHIVSKHGMCGMIMPSSIAMGAYNADLFSTVMKENRLSSFYDFENSKGLFQDVHRSYRFCLITTTGIAFNNKNVNLLYQGRSVSDLQNAQKKILLSLNDVETFSPNTLSLPIFLNNIDAEISKRIYSTFDVLKNHRKTNEWNVIIRRMLSLSDGDDLFVKSYELDIEAKQVWKKLYSGKAIFQFDHRYATYALKRWDNTNIEQHKNSEFEIETEYYALLNEIDKRTNDNFPQDYLLGFRDIARATDERTCIASLIPRLGCDSHCRNIYFENSSSVFIVIFLANLNCIPFDYLVRQKVIGTGLGAGTLEQLAVVPKSKISELEKHRIVTKVLELVYTSWDIKPFANNLWNEADGELKAALQAQWQSNMVATGGHPWAPPEWCTDYGFSSKESTGCPLPPFKWDEDRRAVLKAELDALYAKLYGLTTEELRYILDPQDVYGPDFPGETFRVLKEKDERMYGEYRTKRLVLEAWERLHQQTEKRIEVDLTSTKELMKEWGLHDGIYDIRDCSRITGLSENKVQRWFKELNDSRYEGFGGTTTNDVKRLRISFHGLIELVVIGALRDAKISLSNILLARTKLQTYTNKEYPFATNNVKQHLKVAGKKITFQLPQGNIDLDGTDQFNLDFISDFFRDIRFEGDIAVRMIPARGRGKVVIDPKEANGKPAILNKEVPVDAVLQFYRGPQSVPSLMRHYDLTQDEVLAAVDYWN